MQVVAHRGLPIRFPDNTLAGLIAAAQVADAVEIDVRRSGDGKLVLAHDPTLDGLVVAQAPWSVLGEVDLGGGHHPCLLDEALAALPGTPMQLEVKNLPFQPGFEPDHRLALETAERARPGDVVTSFHPEAVASVASVFPDVDTGLCVTAGVEMSEAVRLCQEGDHSVLVPSVEHPVPALVDAVVAGLRVFPWVVNDPALARTFAEAGVSGIITDDPATVIHGLEQTA